MQFHHSSSKNSCNYPHEEQQCAGGVDAFLDSQRDPKTKAIADQAFSSPSFFVVVERRRKKRKRKRKRRRRRRRRKMERL